VDDVKTAYARGLKEGEMKSLETAVSRAHKRIDKHDGRLTALERVMYAGMGVLVVLEIMPKLSAWAVIQ
tara:strand:+ start:170 stop:376 length:207 start_codon:yes stop_codon:yes gene_type:complete